MRERKQSTSTYHILIYMVLSIDHITPATGKTVSVTLSKNAAAFGAAAGAVTEIANGWYKLAADATDSNTLGSLAIRAAATGCDEFADEYSVVGYDPFDSVRLGLTALPNAAAEAAGGLYTRGSGAGQIVQDANGRIDVNLKATLGTASAGAAGYVAPDWGHVNAAATTLNLSGTTIKTATDVATAITDIQTDVDEVQVTLGTPAGASVSVDVAAVKADTVSLLARIGAFTGSGVNTVLGFLKAVMRKDASLPSDVGGTYDVAADSLEALQDNGISGGGGVTADITKVKGSTARVDALAAALDGTYFGVVASGTISLVSFPLTLNRTPTTDSALVDKALSFTSGANDGVTVWIEQYNAATTYATVSAGLRVAPSPGDVMNVQ